MVLDLGPRPRTSAELNAAVSEFVRDGKLEAVRLLCKQLNVPGPQPYVAIAGLLSVAGWLAESAPDAPIRLRALAVLDALDKLNPAWVEHAYPRGLREEHVPRTAGAFNRLMVSLIDLGGYYHPLELEGVEPSTVPPRGNVRSSVRGYHDREWSLISELISPVFRHGVAGLTILEGGPADGFFTLRCARAGAKVLAYEKFPIMAVRTAVFSALAGFEEQVIVQLAGVEAVDHRHPHGDVDRVDLVLALGLIYHFDDLIIGLRRLTAFRCPIVFEFPSVDISTDTPYDPATHRDPRPVALEWLREWLDEAEFTTVIEPAWRDYNTALPNGAKIREMVFAVPR